jgi:hypothetical protein
MAFMGINQIKKQQKGLAIAIVATWNFWRGDKRFAFLSTFILRRDLVKNQVVLTF